MYHTLTDELRVALFNLTDAIGKDVPPWALEAKIDEIGVEEFLSFVDPDGNALCEFIERTHPNLSKCVRFLYSATGKWILVGTYMNGMLCRVMLMYQAKGGPPLKEGTCDWFLDTVLAMSDPYLLDQSDNALRHQVRGVLAGKHAIVN